MFFEARRALKARDGGGGRGRKRDAAAASVGAMHSDTLRRKSHYFGIPSDIFMALASPPHYRTSERASEREREREREREAPRAPRAYIVRR